MISCVMAVGFTLAAGVVTCALLHCCARCQKEAVMRATQSYCKARSSRITARNLPEAKLSYNFLHLRQSYIVEHVYNHSANSTHGQLFAEPE